MEELKRVQESRVDEFSRIRLVENQDIVNELTTRIQELQNDVNCMNDSRDFRDAESVRSGLSHVTSQPVSFPPHPDPGGECFAVLLECRAVKMGRQAFGTRMVYRERFCTSRCVIISTLSAGIESMEF